MQSLTLIICGLAGVFFHCCFKANSLKNQAKVANVSDFSVWTYIREDYLSIMSSFLSVLIWLLIFGEVAAQYPKLENFQRGTFILMGGSGSYLIQYFFSTAEKKITSVIDHKTNVADNVTNNQ